MPDSLTRIARSSKVGSTGRAAEKSGGSSNPHGQDEAMTFEISSGNVFADLDLPAPEDEALKARIVMRLRAEMERRKLTQGELAAVIGAKQPDVSNLLRGRVLGFSLERMLEFMRALGDDVEITLRPATDERRGTLSLKVV
ncbi:helix-turn-helix domain-containing protein [Methylobacterium sp. E-066]|uniref:helix-turn-helix domain-containing protein n=1 Tax=Methylobacterium sp. E-066 TaxID=2836584 RepID=UPI001FBBF82C|nr:helix-turn-helix transcriptional regulator [Methylobacterium sp. E-066]MCJ2139276.1 helix-turn-helix domain-containing protein [Methylobacterium sp. E-066]